MGSRGSPWSVMRDRSSCMPRPDWRPERTASPTPSILDGNRVVQHSGEVTPEDPADQFLAVGDRPGDWTLEADTTDASGLLFAAWARFVGRGAPCPEDAECVGLPSSATGDAE